MSNSSTNKNASAVHVLQISQTLYDHILSGRLNALPVNHVCSSAYTLRFEAGDRVRMYVAGKPAFVLDREVTVVFTDKQIEDSCIVGLK